MELNRVEIKKDSGGSAKRPKVPDARVIVVSVFGRGNWLAAQLQHEKIAVEYYDLTHLMGIWPPEDLAGPFGLFSSEGLTDLQKEALFAEDAYEEVPNGFTLLLADGPLEFKGPLTQFRLKSLGLDENLVEDKLWRQIEKNWKQHEFKKTWPIHLSNYLSSTRGYLGPEASQAPQGISLGTSFFRRIPIRNSVEKGLKWLEALGVPVYRNKRILDFAREGNKLITGLEIQAEGMEFCSQLVWCLTSEETYFVEPRLGSVLYPQGMLESHWTWVRYRVLLESEVINFEMPMHVCYIRELESPWTHENLMLILGTASPGQYDVWVKIPTLQRFNKDYLVRRGDKIMEAIYNKFAEVGCRIQSYPQEYYYTYSQIGAPRLPIYSLDSIQAWQGIKFKNVETLTPEVWKHTSWQGQISCAIESLGRLKNWWSVYLQKSKREINNSEVGPHEGTGSGIDLEEK